MKKLVITIVFLGWYGTMNANETAHHRTVQISHTEEISNHEQILEILTVVKNETTVREWNLFCDLTERENIYPSFFGNEKDFLNLSWEEALELTAWLASNQKDNTYLSQILQEIDECPAPSEAQIAELCLNVRFSERDPAPDSLGYTYHRSLWNMACAKPKIDSAQVGREKVRAMWNKYKEDIRCPIGTNSPSEDLNITKFAIDSTNHRFTSELVISYKLDFNFIDKKDGKTLLDFVQKRIEDEKRYIPTSEIKLREYGNLYQAIVKNGGKHAKDLTPEELKR